MNIWMMILILLVFIIPFVIGFFRFFESPSGWPSTANVLLYFSYLVLIVLGLGGYAIAYLVRKKGVVGLLIGILILLVLIPLALFGTCYLADYGGSIRNLFVR